MRRNLTDEQALAIYHSDDSLAVLSAKHGICKSGVSLIRSGKLYQAVTGGVSRGYVRAPYRITKERAKYLRACHEAGESPEAIAGRLQLPLSIVNHTLGETP
jgi:hypothetical protein